VLLTTSTRIIDVTLPISPALPVWPGDPAIDIQPLLRIADGGGCNTTRIAFPTHCGTHVDPPKHFFDNGPTLSDLPLDRWVGPCQVVRIPDEVVRIEPTHLQAAGIDRATTRLLLKTGNSTRWDTRPHAFQSGYAALTRDAARWVVERGIALIGIDYLSFELDDDADHLTHKIILGAGVVAIEALDLRAVEPGFYDLVCLPLKLEGGDGAPARVILLSGDDD
jgi:arylformamidase